MSKDHWLLSAFKIIGLVLTLGGSMSACSSETSWKEEVLLHDGSKIIVTRSLIHGGRREIGQVSPIKEHTITFTIPATNQVVTWKDEYSEDVGSASFNLMLLDMFKGTAFLVVSPTGCIAYNKWGQPNPPYVFFKYQGKEWALTTLKELPSEFKIPNLVINTLIDEKKLVNQGLVSAELVKELNSGFRQKEFKAILREPLEAADLCPQYSSGPKAPIPITPMTSPNKASSN